MLPTGYKHSFFTLKIYYQTLAVIKNITDDGKAILIIRTVVFLTKESAVKCRPALVIGVAFVLDLI
jgi:hypothetical protein